MKRLLMLGGDSYQVTAIKKAREMGYYVITCDYLEDNPGHKYAHEYHNVSTTDKEAVLALAKSLNIDGIICYYADSGVPTAAYVAEKLGLPTSPYKSVEIITKKDLFRQFLTENNFSVPRARGFNTLEEAQADFYNFKLPVIIKPIDLSGSRGVAKIDSIESLPEKVVAALKLSRDKRFILEEYIEKSGYQVEGDGFTVDGKLVFRCFANGHFEAASLKPTNPFVPVGPSWPSNMPEHIQNKIHNELQRLLTLLNMKTGAYNFDIQVDEQENVYFLDMGARNGGNLIPQVIKYATGVDMIEYSIKGALGEDCSDLTMVKPEGYWASYLIHGQKSGIFKGIEIDEEILKNNMVEYDLTIKIGDKISEYTALHERIGTMIMRFSSETEMLEKMDNMTKWINVVVEESLVKSQ